MNKYSLYVDELVQVWKRTYVNVEANSEKDAVNKYLNGEYDDVDKTEYLYETEENHHPITGSSIEIFNKDSEELIYNDYILNDIRGI